MSSIIKTCLVVSLQIGIWQGQKLDREAGRQVTETNNAALDAARVNKHLVPKEILRPIGVAGGAVRAHFYHNTLPWKDNGDRLLTRALALRFIEEQSELKRKFDQAVAELLDGQRYETAIEQAEFRMGDLFNADDYPSTEQLRKRFYVSMDIDGVAPGKDVRLQDSTEILQARVTKAMAGLWERIAKPLEHVAEKLSEQDALFRDATVDNLQAIVDLIPELNFTEDPKLEAIRLNIQDNILAYSPDQLRKDKDARAWAASSANEIMDTMRGFMNAFGNGDGDDE